MKKKRRSDLAGSVVHDATRNLVGQYTVNSISAATGISMPSSSAAFSIMNADIITKTAKKIKL